MLTSAEIRQQFLDFFRSKGHIIVPSAPIVIKNDPTLMFTNAGMNQFKDIFLGEASPKAPRVADTQRCLRVSGKHNDLEEVGIDTYHHTMFEMLGNWSFGDYFKKEAIAWSWELLTEVYKLPKDRLYVTYFEGDQKEGLEKDTETYELWKALAAEGHILPGNKKDNFWEMGETGPCGPCSEIHYDSRPDHERAEINGATLVNADHDQVIEIWNNVFMQFNRLKGGTLQPLPARHVDTGMGFERLVRVLQGKTSNYDSDVFQELIQYISAKSNKKYNSNAKPGDADWNMCVAMRVLADHIRAVSFAIADGQLPSNNKAGYVIRRILRRAVRYSYQYLDFNEPFFHNLVDILADQFKNVFDELYHQKDFVKRVILEEETSFLKTLGAGILRVENYFKAEGRPSTVNDAQAPDTFLGDRVDYSNDINNKRIAGKFAFELSDTYGFPIDLTELIAREKGFTVDMAGFEAALQEQKTRSRAATVIDAANWVVLREEDNTVFTGYDELQTIAHVVKYRKVTAKGKEQFQIVLDKTPFYAEGGGQVGDRGELVFPDGEIIQVTDTKKENGLIIHYTDTLPEDIDDALTAIVEPELRTRTNSNHSATHLLHAAMKQVLGTHVNQKGSLVNADYLRFDFSHFAKVTDEELGQIEAIVNGKVRQNIPLKEERSILYTEAITSGVTALFGEKYGEYVRVITFEDSFSKELCGGTHVQATGQIGFFKIVSESAVAAGVRRIEAITGIAAETYIHTQSKLIGELKDLLKNPKDLPKSIEKLLEEKSALEKRIEGFEARHLVQVRNELLQKDEIINGVNFIGEIVEISNPEGLKKLCADLKTKLRDYVVIVGANIGGKPFVAIGISDTVVAARNLDAVKIIREHVAPLIKGGGGGQKNLATAGGQDVGNLQQVIDRVRTLL